MKIGLPVPFCFLILNICDLYCHWIGNDWKKIYFLVCCLSETITNHAEDIEPWDFSDHSNIKIKTKICVLKLLLTVFIYLITIHWFIIRSLILPLLFDRLNKMKCKANIGLPWPPKTIVASQNRIMKKWGSHVSQRRHFIPKTNISFYLNQGNISINNVSTFYISVKYAKK